MLYEIAKESAITQLENGAKQREELYQNIGKLTSEQQKQFQDCKPELIFVKQVSFGINNWAQCRSEMLSRDPSLDYATISSEIKKRWKGLSDEQRKEFEIKSAQQMERLMKSHGQKIKQKIGCPENPEDHQLSQRTSWHQKKFQKRQKHQKRPRTPFNYFCSEMMPKFKEQHPEEDYQALLKRISLAWSRVPQDEKRKYDQMALEDKKEFANNAPKRTNMGDMIDKVKNGQMSKAEVLKQLQMEDDEEEDDYE